ncbi:MAG: sensor domain-containing diguanylate cyclase [Geobacteraceae bacterium]|nr:sensor domain-containing diguanylate cyclase [Geobacteraceae bacterium]
MDHDPDFYKSLLENIYDGVYFVDVNRKITFWNRAAERITGFSAEEVIGSNCADNILMHVDEQGHHLCNGSCPLQSSTETGCRSKADVYLHHKNGQRVKVSVNASPVIDRDGSIIGSVELFRDISTQSLDNRVMEELKKSALVDTLTDMPNRRYLEMKLNSCLEEFKNLGPSFGVIFGDIDSFKQINDTCGHLIGDDILKMVAKTLAGNIRAVDFVGRWGGEEFVVLITHVSGEYLKAIAEKLRMLVEACFLMVHDKKLQVTISLGATGVVAGDTAESILKRADELMYLAKKSGKNCVMNDCC